MLLIVAFILASEICIIIPASIYIVSLQEIVPLIPEQIEAIKTVTDVADAAKNMGAEDLIMNKTHVPHTTANRKVELNDYCKGIMVYIDFNKTEILKMHGALLAVGIVTYIIYEIGK